MVSTSTNPKAIRGLDRLFVDDLHPEVAHRLRASLTLATASWRRATLTATVVVSPSGGGLSASSTWVTVSWPADALSIPAAADRGSP
jgi:hypothetical protein